MNAEIERPKYHRNKLLPDTERVMKCLSGMRGNFHVPFLDEERQVIASSLSRLKYAEVILYIPRDHTNVWVRTQG